MNYNKFKLIILKRDLFKDVKKQMFRNFFKLVTAFFEETKHLTAHSGLINKK